MGILTRTMARYCSITEVLLRMHGLFGAEVRINKDLAAVEHTRNGQLTADRLQI